MAEFKKENEIKKLLHRQKKMASAGFQGRNIKYIQNPNGVAGVGCVANLLKFAFLLLFFNFSTFSNYSDIV